jgi:MFS family permease
MGLLSRFFGLEQPTPEALRLVKLLVSLMPSFAATFMISTTFWMIYIAESLGGGDFIAGLGMVSFLIILQLVIQTLLDYPTGALGDHIGQRWVIASALICYAIAFGITAISNADSPFIYFVVIYALMGLGRSQESGAWAAWFDNNYRVAMPHDEDRKMYGVMQGRTGMFFQIISTVVLLPGAWLALLYGRTWVFSLQAIAFVILAIIVLIMVKDFPEAEAIRKRQHQQSGGYLRILKDGLRFLWSHPFITFFIIGDIIIMATGTLWWQLLLFPLYFSYLITDVAVSAYRTINFLPMVAAQERGGIWSRRFEPKKWIPRFKVLQGIGFLFYILIALNFFLFPPPVGTIEIVALYFPFTDIPIIEMPIASVIPMVLLLVIFTITDFFGVFADILTQRVMIDVIPNRIRNSMYSLKPTLAIIAAMPLIWIFGGFVPAYGFGATFVLVAIVALFGALLIFKGFSYAIPKAADLDYLINHRSEDGSYIEIIEDEENQEPPDSEWSNE